MPESHVDLDALPQLAADDVHLLWVNDWYDGPVEAVVERAGIRYLMVLHEQSPDHALDVTKQMHWVLFHLSPEQWLDEERWHALFEQVIGHHWCFHHDAGSPEPLEPRDTKAFYEPFARRTPRTVGAALGWVDQLPEH